LERDDDEEAMEPRVSLLPVDDEKVDAIESRDRHDEPDEDVVVELAVLVDMNDEAVELRPKLGKHIHTQPGGDEHTRVYRL
jgi:tryptophanyl-tRNA synthetase